MDNSATSSIIDLDDSNFEKEVTQSDQTVLVDFWAPWCGPCKMIAPLLDTIATEKAGSVKVAKVNVDENLNLSTKYNVRAIPALLFFKSGQLRDQMVGMAQAGPLTVDAWSRGKAPGRPNPNLHFGRLHYII